MQVVKRLLREPVAESVAVLTSQPQPPRRKNVVDRELQTSQAAGPIIPFQYFNILAADRRIVTILFMDIAGFTTICEIVSSERLNQLMLEYFQCMCTIINESDGTLDKVYHLRWLIGFKQVSSLQLDNYFVSSFFVFRFHSGTV